MGFDSLKVPWWELVVRAVVVYGVLLTMLRLTGKRQVGQLSPFDLVLLLILANAVQNSMNAGDESLVGGLVSAATLVLLNFLVGFVTFRSKKLANIVEGTPRVLVHNGKLLEGSLEFAQIDRHELNAALRAAGVSHVGEVAVAMLENNGHVSVIPRRVPRTDKDP